MTAFANTNSPANPPASQTTTVITAPNPGNMSPLEAAMMDACNELHEAVSQADDALIQDLDDRGLLDSTIVMCAGEFGRTPKINKTAGRDHWARSMACIVAGGGLKSGCAHGTSDGSGMVPATDPVAPDDLAATIFHQLGIDPYLELQTSTGRPIQLFREGKIVNKLIA